MLVQQLKELGLHPESPDYLPIARAHILYGCDCYKSIKHFHQEIDHVVASSDIGLSAAQYRVHQCSRAFLIFNLKFYAMYWAKHRRCCEHLAEQFGVCPDDAAVVKLLFQQGLRKQLQQSKLWEYSKQEFSVAAMREHQAIFRQYVSDLLPFIKRTVRAKHRWVVKSHNMQYTEFDSEFTAHSLQAYYSSIPNSRDYANQLNYLRRSIVNYSNNVNNKFGSEKHRRMLNVGTDNGAGAKFELLVRAECQLPVSDDMELNYGDLADPEIAGEAQRRREFQFSIQQLIERHALTKRAKLLRILNMEEIPSFTEFLIEHRYIRAGSDKTNVDWYAGQEIEDCITVVAKYLRVSAAEIRKYLPVLYSQLGLR